MLRLQQEPVVVKRNDEVVGAILSSGWTMTAVRIREQIEPGENARWTYGIEICNPKGEKIADGRLGVFGSRQKIVKHILSIAGIPSPPQCKEKQ